MVVTTKFRWWWRKEGGRRNLGSSGWRREVEWLKEEEEGKRKLQLVLNE